MHEVFYYRKKSVDILKFEMDGSKTHVRHIVHVFKSSHNHFPYFFGSDFLRERIMYLPFDIAYYLIDFNHGNGAFFASFHYAGFDFRRIENLPRTVILYDKYGSRFHFFVSGVSFKATKAFPSAPYGRAVVAQTGIYYPAFHPSAVHTLHFNIPHIPV